MASKFTPAAIVFALVVFAGAALFFISKAHPWMLSRGHTVRVATIPANEDGATFIAALDRETAQEHRHFRLSLIETTSLEASAQELKENRVDVAIARSDNPAVAGGRTIFVLKHLYAALLVPAQASITGAASLKGKIGVLTDGTDIDAMAKVLLDFYGFDEKRIVRLNLKELPAALQRKQVAALLVIGPSGAGPIADAVEAFRKSTKAPPKFVALSEAGAIASRFPVYAKAEISPGAFGGSPTIPAEELTTISANLLLVARPTLSNYAAGELTRLLLATKTKVAALMPEAGQLAAPATEKDLLLPAHPGAIAFLNGEQPNLLDESTNLIFLVSMLTAMVGSLGAWLTTMRKNKKAHELQHQIVRLLAEARSTDPERLGATEQAVERLSESCLQKFIANEISPDDFHNAENRIVQIRALIEKARLASPPDHVGAGDRVVRLKNRSVARVCSRPDSAQVASRLPIFIRASGSVAHRARSALTAPRRLAGYALG